MEPPSRFSHPLILPDTHCLRCTKRKKRVCYDGPLKKKSVTHKDIQQVKTISSEIYQTDIKTHTANEEANSTLNVEDLRYSNTKK